MPGFPSPASTRHSPRLYTFSAPARLAPSPRSDGFAKRCGQDATAPGSSLSVPMRADFPSSDVLHRLGSLRRPRSGTSRMVRHSSRAHRAAPRTGGSRVAASSVRALSARPCEIGRDTGGVWSAAAAPIGTACRGLGSRPASGDTGATRRVRVCAKSATRPCSCDRPGNIRLARGVRCASALSPWGSLPQGRWRPGATRTRRSS